MLGNSLDIRFMRAFARGFAGAGTGSNGSVAAVSGSARSACPDGLAPTVAAARALPASNAARFCSTDLPLVRMACSQASAGKGRAPEPARAPSTTELITLRCSRARASMSSATRRFALARAT